MLAVRLLREGDVAWRLKLKKVHGKNLKMTLLQFINFRAFSWLLSKGRSRMLSTKNIELSVKHL